MLPIGLSSAIVFAPAAWCVFESRGLHRKATPLEISCLLTAAFVALLVIRPVWLAYALSHMPLLRSTRFPVREVFLFLFFVHVWIALRPVTVSRRAQWTTKLVGVAIYLASLAPFRTAEVIPLPLERYLLRSGEGEAYWRRVRALLPADASFVPMYDTRMSGKTGLWKIPWMLLGAGNYPALVEVKSESGYVVPGMKGSDLHGAKPREAFGIFSTGDIARLQAGDPNLRFLVITSVSPVRIELRDGKRRIPLTVPPLPPISEEGELLTN
jgi:hypothetical protein